MIGCIVCDTIEGYCEFCPPPPVDDYTIAMSVVRPIVNRDPGDECDCGRLTIKRSYTATYRGHGTQTRKHMFIGPDSFLEAVYNAEGLCEIGEQLINVTEMT
jgi:hypothetical protein